MRLVVDASVALKWYLRHRDAEQDLEQAAAIGQAIESRSIELYAPPHWVIEVIAVLARIEPNFIDEAIAEMADMKPTLIDNYVVISRAAKMAADLNQHMFDTMYHAVAMECDAVLVTADAQYFGKAHSHGHISLLSKFELT